MGYHASGSGTLQLASDRQDDAVAYLRAALPDEWANVATVADALRVAFDVTNETVTDGLIEYAVEFADQWGSWLTDFLGELAKVGVEGYLTLTGEDAEQWMTSLSAGGLAELNASVYYPGNPHPDAECVALTRRQVRALLSLVAGDHMPDLPDAVEALVRAAS